MYPKCIRFWTIYRDTYRIGLVPEMPKAPRYVFTKKDLFLFQLCVMLNEFPHPQKRIQSIHSNSHSSLTSVLWSVLHWGDPKLSMKSKHEKQYILATVYRPGGDRTAKPSSQLGALINKQDRHSVCIYSLLWLCLYGTEAIFEQARIVEDCMRSIINEDILTGKSIMMCAWSPQPCLSHPYIWIFKST